MSILRWKVHFSVLFSEDQEAIGTNCFGEASIIPFLKPAAKLRRLRWWTQPFQVYLKPASFSDFDLHTDPSLQPSKQLQSQCRFLARRRRVPEHGEIRDWASLWMPVPVIFDPSRTELRSLRCRSIASANRRKFLNEIIRAAKKSE